MSKMSIRFVSSLEDLELYIYIDDILVFRALRYMEFTDFYEGCPNDIVIKLENGGHIGSFSGNRLSCLNGDGKGLITISRCDGVNISFHEHPVSKYPNGYATLSIYNLIDSSLYVPLYVNNQIVTQDLSYGSCSYYKLALGSSIFTVNARGTSFTLPTPPSKSDVQIILTGGEDMIYISHIVDEDFHLDVTDESLRQSDVKKLAREWYVSVSMNMDIFANIFPSGMSVSFSMLHNGIRVINSVNSVIIKYKRVGDLWIDDIPFVIHRICDKFVIIGTKNRHRLLALTCNPIDDELFGEIRTYVKKLGYTFK
jgi:hypothetical protein